MKASAMTTEMRQIKFWLSSVKKNSITDISKVLFCLPRDGLKELINGIIWIHDSKDRKLTHTLMQPKVKIIESLYFSSKRVQGCGNYFKNKFPSGWFGLLLNEPLTGCCWLESTKLLNVNKNYITLIIQKKIRTAKPVRRSTLCVFSVNYSYVPIYFVGSLSQSKFPLFAQCKHPCGYITRNTSHMGELKLQKKNLKNWIL